MINKLIAAAAVLCLMLSVSGCSADDARQNVENVMNVARKAAEIVEQIPEDIAEINSAADAAETAVLDDGGVFRYYGSLLESSEDIRLYNTLNTAISEHRESVYVETRDIDRLEQIVGYVSDDHPEYFWFTEGIKIDGYQKNGVYDVDVVFSYNCTPEQAAEKQQRIDAVTGPVVAALSGLDDYSKVKGVYKYIINSTVYDESYSDQSCCSVLCEGRGVCAGYAFATGYLLNRLGIDNIFVYGISEGEDHAWNLVKVDGQWLQLDTTWGDPVCDDGTQRISWAYFLTDDSEMLSNHTYSRDLPALPACTSTEYNYYAREGRYLDSVDSGRIEQMLLESVTAGESLEFRCTDKITYLNVTNLLFDEHGIIDIVCNVYEQIPTFSREHITYSCDDEKLIIVITPEYY